MRISFHIFFLNHTNSLYNSYPSDVCLCSVRAVKEDVNPFDNLDHHIIWIRHCSVIRVPKWECLLIDYLTWLDAKIDKATESICFSGLCKIHTERRALVNHSGGLSCVTAAIQLSTIGWLLSTLTELMLFVLVLRKRRQRTGYNVVLDSPATSLAPSDNPDMVTVITNDSMAYFAVWVVQVIGLCATLTIWAIHKAYSTFVWLAQSSLL